MRLFSYVVSRDFGFAPNPFFGFCTLACCKPDIRRAASVGDWVAGIGSMQKGLGDQLVYVMEVSEIVDFDSYWSDPRFIAKRPRFNGALKRSYGDNIYHRVLPSGPWIQEDSHHSLEGGKTNEDNLTRDTSRTDKVLISKKFAYWGGEGPVIPSYFRENSGESLIIRTSAHRSKFSDEYIQSFVSWFHSLADQGVCAPPNDWKLGNK